MNWNLILDIVMIVLLGFTMVYAFILNRNLGNFRATKNELDELVKKLSGTIVAAETGIRNLKLAAQEVGGELDDQIQKALGLSNELQFMVESGDSLARRLEGAAVATPKPKLGGVDIIDERAPVKPSAPRSIEDFAARAVLSKVRDDEPPATAVAPKSGLSQRAAGGDSGKPRSRAESQLMADFARIEAARDAQDKAG